MSVDARELARNLLARTTQPAVPAGVPSARTAQAGPATPAPATGSGGTARSAPPARLTEHPAVLAAVQQRELLRTGLAEHGIDSPYYAAHDGVNGAVVSIGGRQLINFSGYNYLGLAGDERVQAAAKAAIDQYGTSASASRVVSGQIPLHAELEQRISTAYASEAAIALGSGYLTNAALLGYLLGPDDVAVCDSLIHNSVVSGTRWAQCRRLSFRHNDPVALDELLTRSRGHFQTALVVLEGVYSMDGDIVALPDLIEVARRHRCLIMVDEAHSFGVLGEHGFGVREHFGLDTDAVDLWVGTLSKSMASYGGFVAAAEDVIEALRMWAPGLSMFAAGSPPPAMGAAIAAFDVMLGEPARLRRLHRNAARLAAGLSAAGFDIGHFAGSAIVPAIIGDSRTAVLAATALSAAGINANPILYPAVAEGEARIRFFVSADHTDDQLDYTIDALVASRR